MFSIVIDTVFNILESTSFDELIVIFVELGVLEVYLYLMESVISHSSCVDDETSLSQRDLLRIFLIVIFSKVILIDNGENWIWLSNDLAWQKFTSLTDLIQSPVEISTFPELSKIDSNLHRDIILLDNISLLNFMPGNQILIVTKYW